MNSWGADSVLLWLDGYSVYSPSFVSCSRGTLKVEMGSRRTVVIDSHICIASCLGAVQTVRKKIALIPHVSINID